MKNYFTQKEYSDKNASTLQTVSSVNGYKSDCWATYVQWKNGGFQVRKGEKGTPILNNGYSRDEKTGLDTFRFSGHSVVFNRMQVDKIEQ